MAKPGCSEAEIAKAKKLADELDEATDQIKVAMGIDTSIPATTAQTSVASSPTIIDDLKKASTDEEVLNILNTRTDEITSLADWQMSDILAMANDAGKVDTVKQVYRARANGLWTKVQASDDFKKLTADEQQLLEASYKNSLDPSNPFPKNYSAYSSARGKLTGETKDWFDSAQDAAYYSYHGKGRSMMMGKLLNNIVSGHEGALNDYYAKFFGADDVGDKSTSGINYAITRYIDPSYGEAALPGMDKEMAAFRAQGPAGWRDIAKLSIENGRGTSSSLLSRITDPQVIERSALHPKVKEAILKGRDSWNYALFYDSLKSKGIKPSKKVQAVLDKAFGPAGGLPEARGNMSQAELATLDEFLGKLPESSKTYFHGATRDVHLGKVNESAAEWKAVLQKGLDGKRPSELQFDQYAQMFDEVSEVDKYKIAASRVVDQLDGKVTTSIDDMANLLRDPFATDATETTFRNMVGNLSIDQVKELRAVLPSKATTRFAELYDNVTDDLLASERKVTLGQAASERKVWEASGPVEYVDVNVSGPVSKTSKIENAKAMDEVAAAEPNAFPKTTETVDDLRTKPIEDIVGDTWPDTPKARAMDQISVKGREALEAKWQNDLKDLDDAKFNETIANNIDEIEKTNIDNLNLSAKRKALVKSEISDRAALRDIESKLDDINTKLSKSFDDFRAGRKDLSTHVTDVEQAIKDKQVLLSKVDEVKTSTLDRFANVSVKCEVPGTGVVMTNKNVLTAAGVVAGATIAGAIGLSALTSSDKNRSAPAATVPNGSSSTEKLSGNKYTSLDQIDPNAEYVTKSGNLYKGYDLKEEDLPFVLGTQAEVAAAKTTSLAPSRIITPYSGPVVIPSESTLASGEYTDLNQIDPDGIYLIDKEYINGKLVRGKDITAEDLGKVVRKEDSLAIPSTISSDARPVGKYKTLEEIDENAKYIAQSGKVLSGSDITQGDVSYIIGEVNAGTTDYDIATKQSNSFPTIDAHKVTPTQISSMDQVRASRQYILSNGDRRVGSTLKENDLSSVIGYSTAADEIGDAVLIRENPESDPTGKNIYDSLKPANKTRSYVTSVQFGGDKPLRVAYMWPTSDGTYEQRETTILSKDLEKFNKYAENRGAKYMDDLRYVGDGVTCNVLVDWESGKVKEVTSPITKYEEVFLPNHQQIHLDKPMSAAEINAKYPNQIGMAGTV